MCAVDEESGLADVHMSQAGPRAGTGGGSTPMAQSFTQTSTKVIRMDPAEFTVSDTSSLCEHGLVTGNQLPLHAAAAQLWPPHVGLQ